MISRHHICKGTNHPHTVSHNEHSRAPPGGQVALSISRGALQSFQYSSLGIHSDRAEEKLPGQKAAPDGC